MAKRKKVTRKRKKKVVRRVGKMTPERAAQIHVKRFLKSINESLPHGYEIKPLKKRRKRK